MSDFALLSADWPANMVFLAKWITEPMVYAVIVQGDLKTIDSFSNDILQNAPPASLIKSIEINPTSLNGYEQFQIARVNRLIIKLLK